MRLCSAQYLLRVLLAVAFWEAVGLGRVQDGFMTMSLGSWASFGWAVSGQEDYCKCFFIAMFYTTKSAVLARSRTQRPLGKAKAAVM